MPSILRLNNVLLYAYTTFCLPIHWSMDIYCFRLWATANNPAVNIGLQISVCVPAFNCFQYISRAGAYDSSIFNFLRKCHFVLSQYSQNSLFTCSLKYTFYKDCAVALNFIWNFKISKLLLNNQKTFWKQI